MDLLQTTQQLGVIPWYVWVCGFLAILGFTCGIVTFCIDSTLDNSGFCCKLFRKLKKRFKRKGENEDV